MGTDARLVKAVRRYIECRQETYDTLPEIKHFRFPVELDAVALLSQELTPHLLVLQLALSEALVNALQILAGQVEHLRCPQHQSEEQQEALRRMDIVIPLYRKKPELVTELLLPFLLRSLADPLPNYAKLHSQVHLALSGTPLALPPRKRRNKRGP